MTKRLNSYRRGYNLAWNKYSKSYRRENPWCVKCLPKLTAAQCVDHIKPIGGKDDPLFWETDNHQSLCWACHSVKTATEDGGFRGKDYKPIEKITTGLDGWPIGDTDGNSN